MYYVKCTTFLVHFFECSPEMAELEALIVNSQEEHRVAEYTCDAWTALIAALASLPAP